MNFYGLMMNLWLQKKIQKGSEMDIDDMSRLEKSLLLYLETRAVDYGGVVDTRHMNNEDMEIAKQWNRDEFVRFGRICFNDIVKDVCSHWCHLTEEAWELSYQLRRNRADRMWKKRDYQKTEEKN